MSHKNRCIEDSGSAVSSDSQGSGRAVSCRLKPMLLNMMELHGKTGRSATPRHLEGELGICQR